MKKLWQCSVLSSTLRVAVPSLASHLRENGKSANRNAHQNRETEVFWHKKSKNRSKKIAKTAKPKIRMPPLTQQRCPTAISRWVSLSHPKSIFLHLDAM